MRSHAKRGNDASVRDKMEFRSGAIRPLMLLIAVLLLCHVPVRAQEIEVTLSGIRAGAVLLVENRPVVVSAPDALVGDLIDIPDTTLQARVVADPDNRDLNLLIPIKIEDSRIAAGTRIQLVDLDGSISTVLIPPRKILIPFPFNTPAGQMGALSRDHSRRGLLMFMVVPKITKKAKVSTHNTADEGLVADVVYEGMAAIEVRDILKRLNRRDADITLYSGKEMENRWTFIIENLLETHTPRQAGIERTFAVGKDSYTLMRIENANNFGAMQLGGNLILRTSDRRLSIEYGNVDKRVEDSNHINAVYADGEWESRIRLEGLSSDGFRSVFPFAFRVRKLGWQMRKKDLFPGLDVTVGNLVLDQDREDYGHWTSKINFTADYYMGFGTIGPKAAFRPVNFNGFLNTIFWGEGESIWLRSTFEADLTFRRLLLFGVRFNEDFVHIAGAKIEEPWQSRLITINWYRDYFNRRDWLNKVKIDSVFLDIEFTRRGHKEIYNREIKFGITKTINIKRYEMPLEFNLTLPREKRLIPGVTFSIREFL